MPTCEPLRPSQVSPVIDRAARRQKLEPALLRAIISQESAWQPCALSRKGALGLMQLMPETAAILGVGNPFDPAQNIDGGARYLRHLLGRYDGDLALALAAYNSGPSRVDEAGGVPPIPETVEYVQSILRRLKSPQGRIAP
ncbi:MAG: lytic transglycosylase domain-containing protein [bacterium]